MEVFEAIRKRHSTRSYLSEEVPSGKLEKILEAARLAPSAGNIDLFSLEFSKFGGKRQS